MSSAHRRADWRFGTLLIAATAVLLVALTVVFVHERQSAHGRRLDDLSALALALHEDSVAALASGDPVVAAATLSALKVRPSLTSAALYMRDGALLARHPRGGPTAGPTAAGELVAAADRRVRLGTGYLELYEPVKVDGRTLGVLYLSSDLHDLNAALLRSSAVFGGVLLASGLLAFFLARRLQQLSSRTMLELAEAIREAANGADLSIRALDPSDGEAATLVTELNELLAKRQQREDKLLHQRDSLLRDATEDKRQLAEANEKLSRVAAELKRTSEAADSAGHSKAEFLANMSHEIRTPMNGILGMAELLLRSPLNGHQQRLAETVKRSGDSLLKVVNDILDFSRIEAGKLELQPTDFDPTEVVEDVVEMLGPTAHAKGLELLCLFGNRLPRGLVGDSARVRQILRSLIGNAVKFTDCGDVEVRVRTVLEDSKSALLGFEVRDTGIGISQSARANLFEAFTQADASASRRHEGTGLGLAIAKRLATLMGGNLSFESQLGKGSCFRFTARFGKSRALVVASPELEPQLRGRRVLIVDGSASSRAAVKKQCARLGLQAATTAGANGALALLAEAADQSRPYHLVLTDASLPDLSGRELAEAIASDPQLAGVRCVQVGTLAETTGQNEDEPGIAACLTKPVRLSVLASCVETVLACPPATLQPRVPAAAGGHASPAVSTDDGGQVAAPTLDLDVLDSLDALRGQPELKKRVVGLFLEHTPAQLEELRSALQIRDGESMRRAAHTVKSSSANVGASRLSKLCAALEQQLREARLDDTRERVEEIEEEYARLGEALQACRAGGVV